MNTREPKLCGAVRCLVLLVVLFLLLLLDAAVVSVDVGRSRMCRCLLVGGMLPWVRMPACRCGRRLRRARASAEAAWGGRVGVGCCWW